jgi:uncharacterized membrane protein
MQLIAKNKEVLRSILSLCMLVVGASHFIIPEPFVKIVPAALPHPLALVYISGFFELLGGVGLLIPSVSRAAAWGLVVLFIAVYPANINMAVNQIALDGIPNSPWFQAIRLPFQFVLIAWAWWYTRKDI